MGTGVTQGSLDAGGWCYLSRGAGRRLATRLAVERKRRKWKRMREHLDMSSNNSSTSKRHLRPPPFHLLLSLTLPQLGNPRRPKPADQTKVFHVLRPYQRKKFRRITDESLVVILTTARLSDPRLTGYLNCIRYREQRPQVAWTRCWPSLLLLISFSAHT